MRKKFLIRFRHLRFLAKGSVDRLCVLRIVLKPQGKHAAELGTLTNFRFEAGSTESMPKISGGKLREMPVPIPSSNAEREAIAEVLNNADSLIESLEQLIAKKRLVKQGTMQELLTGKTRLL